MAVPLRHLITQAPVLAALARVALGSARPRGRAAATLDLPGPWIDDELPPRPEALVHDYIVHVGGDPSWYRGSVPAHLFPQWGFPLSARALSGLSYPLVKVMNAGCRIAQKGRLPAGEPLLVRARIEAIDDDGRRAIITQRVVTGTRSAPDVITADLRAFVPLGRKDGKGEAKSRPSVPEQAEEIASLRLGADAGLDFAKLTGDMNPIHWIGPYARAAGFRGVILHGFATLARAVEALIGARFAGDPAALSVVDVKFTRPLVLPARVRVYATSEGGLWVGDAPGGDAYLEGRFETEG